MRIPDKESERQRLCESATVSERESGGTPPVHT